MNRLTDKDSGYLVNDEIYASGKNSQCKEMTGNYSKEVIEEAIDRLAEYEETGLTPEEVTEMINRFESFVSEMTGNRMSKSSYTVKAMVSVANDYQQSICDECGDRQGLAQYEQLGTVEELSELVKAKRDGRCVVLPCKVGDTVYIRRYSLAQKQNIIIEARVAAVKVFRTGFQIDAVTHGGAVNKCEWGRQCFATRAEAEEALKEAQHE